MIEDIVSRKLIPQLKNKTGDDFESAEISEIISTYAALMSKNEK